MSGTGAGQEGTRKCIAFLGDPFLFTRELLGHLTCSKVKGDQCLHATLQDPMRDQTLEHYRANLDQTAPNVEFYKREPSLKEIQEVVKASQPLDKATFLTNVARCRERMINCRHHYTDWQAGSVVMHRSKLDLYLVLVTTLAAAFCTSCRQDRDNSLRPTVEGNTIVQLG